MSEILQQESTDFTVNGKCSGCGACCPDCLNISDFEIQKIRHYIKQHDIKACNHISPLQAPGTAVDLLCPFLDTNKKDKKCTIYPVRPSICKEYICSETKEQAVRRLAEKNNKEIVNSLNHDGQSILPVNLGQTFFPEIYQPHIGDCVIFNKRYPIVALRYGTIIFKVITEPDDENKVTICNETMRFHYDIAGLTKII